MLNSIDLRFKLLRQYAGLTQREMSRVCGLQRSYWSTIECKFFIPSHKTAYLISTALNISEKWLMTGQGEAPTQEHIQREIQRLKRSELTL